MPTHRCITSIPQNDSDIVLGILADTHIPDRRRQLPHQVEEVFREAGVQQILHAGDISIPNVLQDLSRVAPVIAVRGNRDWLFRKTLPWKTTLTVGGITIGLIHGHGNWRAYGRDKFAYLFEGYQFRRYYPLLTGAFPNARVIVYGHTHRPENRWENGQLLFNPGSACCSPYAAQEPSVGLLYINPHSQSLHAEIVKIG